MAEDVLSELRSTALKRCEHCDQESVRELLGRAADEIAEWRSNTKPDDTDHIDIVFDGPPSHQSGRFVEVEDANGRSVKFGEWVQRKDGYWVLRISRIGLSRGDDR